MLNAESWVSGKGCSWRDWRGGLQSVCVWVCVFCKPEEMRAVCVLMEMIQ